MYYGLTIGQDLNLIAKEVCECLGNGAYDNAHLLILETAGAETHQGLIEDKTTYAGMGLCQFDKMPFYDVKNRTNNKTKEKIKHYFGVEIDLVEWEHLRYNPFLSLLFCRMKYILVSAAIPFTQEERAAYWKKWYNSEEGKGTVTHYMQANQSFMYA